MPTLSLEDREVLNVMTGTIIGCAIEVHRSLGGPGLLESVYEEALCYELAQKNYSIERQVTVPVMYKNIRLESQLRLDLLVNNEVIIECKAVSTHNPIYQAQLLTYLRVSNRHLGLLINFGEIVLREGIRRVVHNF